MRGISLKTIFIVLIILLIGWAIYHNLFHTDQTDHLVGQTTKQTAKETIQSNDLRIGIIEFDNMNPILSNNKNVQDISRLIFDPLFTLTQDYRLQESLATEWSKLDEKTYLIKLRENVKWQDGNDFNASDVVFTIDMLKKKDNHSVYYYNVQNITSVEEIDEYTLKDIVDSLIYI